MDLREAVKLRIMTMQDLDAVTRIDYSLLGRRRRGHWEAKLELSATTGVPCLAAEAGGEVIGFIFGATSGCEYWIPQNVAWIDTIGVVKEQQNKGVARLLVNEMVSMFKKMGIDTVYIFLNWKDWDLLRFFDRMGFKKGEMIHLELSV